jgi:hypothetical protein
MCADKGDYIVNEETRVSEETRVAQAQTSDEEKLVIREVSLEEIEQIDETFVPAWGFGCGAGC